MCCVPVLPPRHVVPENLAATKPINCRPLDTPLPYSMFSDPGPIKLQKLSTGLEPSQACPGREISSKINTEILHAWLQSCMDCKRDRSKTLPPSFRLIDVNQDCVVEAPSDPDYAILSYVWGSLQREFLLALKSNFESLKVPGSICPENPLLPKTIRDAIILTKALGYRYLWVDSVCIVQDDASSITQINAMDAIYSLADFTIVAASGVDADAGIHGSPDTPRMTHQFKATVQGVSLVCCW